MIYKGARAVIQGGATLGTSQTYANRAARKAQDVRKSRESAATAKERVNQVEQTIEDSGLRGDDGVPPGYPTVTAEPFFHQVDLYWPDPPASDEVVGSLVRIRPEGESSRIVRRPRHSATIKNLPHKPHTFEVLLFDKWGRESLWSDAVTATPMLTAAETIDLGEIAMLGRLRGLLPNLNLATIEDATKLATNLIDSGHLAPDSVKRVQLEDAAVNGVKIADGAVTGPKLPNGAITGPKIADRQITATKVGEGEITTPLLAANSVEADKIAASAVTTTKLDAGAVNADKLAANSVTTPKINAGAVVADSIAANQVTTPKINTNAVTANEIATNAVRAAQINANAIQTYHILAGAVTADTMASQNAAAFNLWAQNAMIRSAAIQSLTADKITAGQMTAGTITIAGGGAIRAGRTILDSRGLSIPGLPGGTATLITENQDYKITNTAGTGGMYFRAPDSATSAHSTVVQGDSRPNQRGMVWLAGMADASDWDHPSNALVRVGSYRPDAGDPSFIDCFGANATYAGRHFAQLFGREGNANVISYGGNIRLISDGVIDCAAPLRPWYVGVAANIGSGGYAQWTHGFGRKPDLVMGWTSDVGTAGMWRPLPEPNGTVFVNYADDRDIRVNNTSNVTRRAGVVCY